MLKIAIGHSEDADTSSAVKDVLNQCRSALGDRTPNAGLIFASVSYDFPEILKEILKVYPDIQLSGCSSYGEISSNLVMREDSLALMLISSDEVSMQSGLVQKISENAGAEAFSAAEKSLQAYSKKPALCCVFADGLVGNVSATIEGLQKYLGKMFPIVGGNACDDWKFEKVYQFLGDKVVSDGASFLVFSEPLKSSNVVCHGRKPFPSVENHIVTKSDKNMVYTIGNQSALDFYQSQIGILQSYEPYALLVYHEDSDRYVIRSPFKINREDGSIFFSGEVPQNSTVNISKLSSPKDTLEAADACIKKALKDFTGQKIELALVFSCALRKEILGTDTPQEIEIIKQQLPKDTPIFGYYTFGEIGPFDSGFPSLFHNETIVISLIGE